jgi:hypothetical protein
MNLVKKTALAFMLAATSLTACKKGAMGPEEAPVDPTDGIGKPTEWTSAKQEFTEMLFTLGTSDQKKLTEVTASVSNAAPRTYLPASEMTIQAKPVGAGVTEADILRNTANKIIFKTNEADSIPMVDYGNNGRHTFIPNAKSVLSLAIPSGNKVLTPAEAVELMNTTINNGFKDKGFTLKK